MFPAQASPFQRPQGYCTVGPTTSEVKCSFGLGQCGLRMPCDASDPITVRCRGQSDGCTLPGKCPHLLRSISEYTPAHSTVSHFPTNFRSPVFCYWGKTEPALLDVDRRFVNPSLQNSRNAIRQEFLYERARVCMHLDVRKEFFPQVD